MNDANLVEPATQRAKCEPEHGNPHSPNDATIHVHLTKGCPQPEFYLETDLPKGANGNPTFENKHKPGFYITFVLHDETGGKTPYVFALLPDDACWSQWGTECPDQPAWEVFCPRTVNGTTLVVYNDNPTPAGGDFMYTLRVTNDGGKHYCNLDPGGTDSNGPRT